VIACFPVYRTYIEEGMVEPSAEDRRHILAALAAAKRRNRSMSASIFDFIGDILLLRDPDGASAGEIADRRELVLRLQQLTGPVMAKGLEDTTFYRYYPLASLAEVGSRPGTFTFTLERFHEWNRHRRAAWPLALSATATHDSKRGEDMRARLDVLSEMPREWQVTVRRWQRLLRPMRQVIDEQPVPSPAEEYLFFQTVLGAMPADAAGKSQHGNLVDRIAAYMNKAMREAKLHTSWISPNETYEAAVDRFVREALADTPDNRFLADVRALLDRLALPGIAGSLAQALIKVTAPGVPDFYQGTELFDLSLVDPDNRRPVDFDVRRALLASMAAEAGDGEQELLRRLAGHPTDGALKLQVIRQALALRRRRRALFEDGEYLPLSAAALHRRHVVAFARRRGADAAITVAARFLTQLPGSLPFGTTAAFADGVLELPADLQRASFREVLSGRTLTPISGGGLALADLFAIIPVALLEAT
jgi:(1->4)-alpha-D-glucan 1-alpha-D-glucosylmutase